MAFTFNKTGVELDTTGRGGQPFSDFIPLYWDQVLGQNLYPNLHFYQFGVKRTIPSNFGFSIKIPRIKKQNIVTQVNSASEGVPPATKGMCGEFVSGTLKQFTGVYRHTDILLMTSISDVVELALKDISRDMAKAMDSHIRNQLSSSTGAYEANANALSSGTVLTESVLKASDLLRGAVQLENNDNPRPADGFFPTILSPFQIYDLQASLTANGWFDINKYAGNPGAVEHIYRGEVGRLFGARVITSTNIPKFTAGAAGVNVKGLSADQSGYQGFMFAPDAYYVTEINEGTARTFVKPLGSGGTYDPVNQISTVGAKVFFTAIRADWGGEIRRCNVQSGASLLT